MLPRLILLLLLISGFVRAESSKTEVGGHTKFRVIAQTYPENSLIRDFVGSDSLDVAGNLRLNLKSNTGSWSFDAAYQLIAAYGDRLEFSRNLPPGSELFFSPLPDDSRRWLDLTTVITDSSKSTLLHRLDRLWVGYTSERTVVRFGRQALSWGNGFFYAPMDLVNPFDPAAIDKEYKAGDDMFYAQYLRDSGSDLQAVYVIRRNLRSGEVESGEAAIAFMYHGFAGEWEYDVLVARNYGDAVVGAGAAHAIGGAMWSGDIVFTDTDTDLYVQLVTNLSYSWTWAGKNMSGAIEYYFNDFGQSSGDYDPQSLADNPDLLRRLGRSELFTLGRHYVAASVMIEMSPLWGLSPTILMNIGDPSALLQLVTNYSMGDNMTFLGSINLPLGASGTEFGGIETGIQNRYLASGIGVFAQFAWYF